MNRRQKTLFLIGFAFVFLGTGMLIEEVGIPDKIYYKLNPPVYFSPQSEYPIKPQELLAVINKEREKRNLPSLKENSILGYAAYQRALDIKNNRDFSHQATVSGQTYGKLASELGYRYKWVAENLAIGFNDSETIVGKWILSEKHRVNLLNPKYTEIGVSTLETDFVSFIIPVVTVAIFGAPL